MCLCACANQLVQAVGWRALTYVLYLLAGHSSKLSCVHVHQPTTRAAQFPSPTPSQAVKLQRLGTAALKYISFPYIHYKMCMQSDSQKIRLIPIVLPIHFAI